MPHPISSIFEELQFLSDRLSNQVRTISLSILAFVWLVIAVSRESSGIDLRLEESLVIWSGLLAFVALICDFFQYFIGYLYVASVRDKTEKENKKEYEYDYSCFRYRSRTFLFWAKQAALIASVIIALTTIIIALTG